MPSRPKSICRHAGCSALIAAPGYCERHEKNRIGWYRTSTASTTERGYGNSWRKLREIVMRRDCGICQCDECKGLGRIRAAHEVDHYIPKSQGGTDELSNLRAMNRECHKAKTERETNEKLYG